MLYVPLEDNNDTDNEYENNHFFDFKETITYKYMVCSSQFVDANVKSYSSYLTYRCFLLFRMISMVFIFASVVIEVVFSVEYYQHKNIKLSFLNKMFATLVMILWMTRHVVLYFTGTYLFAKHQNGIHRMIEKLQHPAKQSYEKSEELKCKLIEIDKEMNRLIGWNIFLACFDTTADKILIKRDVRETQIQFVGVRAIRDFQCRVHACRFSFILFLPDIL